MKRKKMIIAALMLSVVTITGCNKNFDNDVTDGYRIGHRYYVHDMLSFQIDSIRDYRCPADMFCIWSGDVDMFFKIYYQRQRIDTMIHLITNSQNPFDIGGYRWKITEVSPYPGSSEKKRETRIKIEIKSNIPTM